MSQPKLQLSKYFFVNVFVVANINHRHDDKDKMVCNFKINSNLGVNKDNENNFQLQLDITTDPEESANQSYDIAVSVVGYFEVAPDFGDKKKLVAVNGASILYAAARDFILSITSRGPWPAVMIPTFSFLTAKDHVEEKKEPEESQLSSPEPAEKKRKTKKQPPK
ncbi:MAG: preprotein translocase subunit SecB [Syntrophus sp. PtaB.Bin138]|nr:MAG: preprotein translocase subunit SecB [Syntrophus sp. PtaB.Bin138]